MKKYYELIFSKNNVKHDYEKYAYIGVYSKKKYAKKVRRKLMKQKKYFAENKDGFIINTIHLDHNVEWKDGFITYYYK